MIQTTSKKFYTAKYERIFKKIMLEDETDMHLLEALLECILGSKVEIVSLPRTEFAVDTTYEKSKTGDLVIKLNGKYINLEIETGVGPETRAKNFSYLCSMYKKNIVRSEKYDIDTLFLQIILQYGLKDSRDLFEWYKIQSDEHIFIENVQILEINMEKMKKIWYDKITRDIKKYKYLIMLDLPKEELENLESDEIVAEFKSKIFELNENESFINDISKEEEQILMQNTRMDIAFTRGRKEQQMEIAKSLLLNTSLSIEDISKNTNLSIEEIEQIKSTL